MATLVVYLDLSKAYDSIVPAILLHKIYHIGFRGNLAYYLQNFLTNKRTIQTRIGRTLSNVYEITTGLPQGSCISPLLFNIMINDIFERLDDDIHFSIYADDIAIWAQGQSIEQISQKL